MFMRPINHVITGPETRLGLKRVISKLDSFPYTCGIIYFTGICYRRHIFYIVLCIMVMLYTWMLI